VREDDEIRQVTAAQLATDPLTVAILVDSTKDPQGTDATTQDMRKALASFVTAMQGASGDTAMSLTQCAGAAVTDVSFTTRSEELRSGIQRMGGSPQSVAVLLEALMDASQRLGRASSPRRAIVSVDFDSSAEGSYVLPTRVAEAVHAAGASFWAISIQRTGVAFPGLNVPGIYAAPVNVRQSLLSVLPDLTGGEQLHVIGTASLESTLLRLADALTHQYLVTYIRPDAKPVVSISAESPRGAKTLIAPWVR